MLKSIFFNRRRIKRQSAGLISGCCPSNTSAAVVTPPVESSGEFITYTVRYGDTIWDIVKMFDNVTTSEVLALNNISDPGKIQVGQKLKIKKKI